MIRRDTKYCSAFDIRIKIPGFGVIDVEVDLLQSWRTGDAVSHVALFKN